MLYSDQSYLTSVHTIEMHNKFLTTASIDKVHVQTLVAFYAS